MLTAKKKIQLSEKNPSHCYFLHQKSYMDTPEIEPGLGYGV